VYNSPFGGGRKSTAFEDSALAPGRGRIMKSIKLIFCKNLLLICGLLLVEQSFSQHQNALRSHVETLSSPLLAGRETGSWGQKLAALYIQTVLGEVSFDQFQLTHIEDGGTIIINSDTLTYKTDFFYSGFDSQISTALSAEEFTVAPCLKAENYKLSAFADEKVVFYLVDDWADFLDRFGHHFESNRYTILRDEWYKEVFLNAESLSSLQFQSVHLQLIENTTSRFTENLIFPVYWNENNTETLVICAHYDHLGQQDSVYYPGADDNASGVAVLLELAQLLAQDTFTFTKNIQIVFFSGEEQGLFGSEYFVNFSNDFQENTVLCINLDMVGFIYSNDPAIYIVDYVPGDLYDDFFDGIESTYVQFSLIHHENFLNEFSSDHISFVTQGIPAYMFFTGLHPYYHSPEDTAEKLNYDAMNVLTLTLYNLTRQLAK